MDFNFVVGNHPRNAKDFYHLVPQLAEPKHAPGVQLAPVLAIQVTLFPNRGIFGFTHHHVVGDGRSLAGFTKSWALLNRFGGNEQFLADESIPYYDRSIVKDPYGIGMSILDEMKKNKLEMCDIVTPPDDKVRATFIVARKDIEKLKNLILSRRPSLNHVTSFRVTCAYVWTCLIKSETAIGEEIDENGMEFFMCAADCRTRLDPPLPPTFFGNCILSYIGKTRHADLVGKEGFTIVVELIGETIKKRMKDEEWSTLDANRALSVAGSQKFDLYAVDFGWGRPEKLEFISIDSDTGISMSLSKSKDSDEDLDIALSLPIVS